MTVIWKLVGPAGEPMLERLHNRVTYETDYKDNHRNSKYSGGIELRSVFLRQRTESDEGDEHFAVDHTFDCAAHAEAKTGV